MRAGRALALLCSCAAAWLPAPAHAAAPLELSGTWYVLVHYTDSESANPSRVHWEDRIWVFDVAHPGCPGKPGYGGIVLGHDRIDIRIPGQIFGYGMLSRAIAHKKDFHRFTS